jgi:hypothetical protein
MRQALRSGLVLSAGVFLFALVICLADVWLEPGRIGQLYGFGVTAGTNGHHSIGIRPAVVLCVSPCLWV